MEVNKKAKKEKNSPAIHKVTRLDKARFKIEYPQIQIHFDQNCM